MNAKKYTALSLLFVLLQVFSLAEPCYSQEKIDIYQNPDSDVINFDGGPQRIFFSVKETGNNWEYKWAIRGTGGFKDGKTTGPSTYYLLPKTMTGMSEDVVIDVTIKNADGKVVAKGSKKITLVREGRPTGNIRVRLSDYPSEAAKFLTLKVFVSGKEMGTFDCTQESNLFNEIPAGKSKVFIQAGASKSAEKSVNVKENKASDVSFEVRKAIVSELLLMAKQSLRRYDLTTSTSGKSAKELFDAVLKIDPENKTAKNGDCLISDKYLSLAEKRRPKDKKRKYVETGLNLCPGHEGLLEMLANLDKPVAPTPTPTPVEPTPTPTPVEPTPTPTPVEPTPLRDKPIVEGIIESYMPELVELDRIWFGKYEVSFKEYDYYYKIRNGIKWSDKLLAKYKKRYKAEYVEKKNVESHMPVTSINWRDALKYVRWLSEVTGQNYRLPKKSEWELAAFGGAKKQPYFWGDQIGQACRYANVSDKTALEWHPAVEDKKNCVNCDDGCSHVSPCGNYLPNSFNLYDMIGNAYEWVRVDSSKGYILKGGSYLDWDIYLDIRKDRILKDSTFKSKSTGFRVVREK